MVPSISARDWNPVEPLPVTQSTPGRTNDRCPRRLAEAVPVPGANVCPVTPVANGPGFGWQRPVVIGGTTLDLGGAAYRLLQMGRLAQCGLERRLPANVIPSRCRCGPHVPAPPHRHRALPRGVPTRFYLKVSAVPPVTRHRTRTPCHAQPVNSSLDRFDPSNATT
jgi:hypothetical protein